MGTAPESALRQPGRPLSIETPARVSFEQNFINQVVCEVRFPTILELETQSPAEIQKAVRKEYPSYSKEFKVRVTETEELQQRVNHIFTSKDGRWRFVLRMNAFSLETRAYKSFDEFYGKLDGLVRAIGPLLDTDYFTRIGLRYINILPTAGTADLDGWVRPELLAPLSSGAFGEPVRYFQEFRGFTSTSSYSFRHGVSPNDDGAPQGYILDSDVFDDATDANETMKRVVAFHDTSYALFSWAIGPKARERMLKGEAR